MDRFGPYPDNWRKKVMGVFGVFLGDTGKVFIGVSNDLYQRRTEHQSALRNGKHSNAQLQNAYDDGVPLVYKAIATKDRFDATRVEASLRRLHASSGIFINHNGIRSSERLAAQAQECEAEEESSVARSSGDGMSKYIAKTVSKQSLLFNFMVAPVATTAEAEQGEPEQVS